MLSDTADMQARERVGTVLNDKWTLERVLGVGGMAAVYAARHRNGARAAVKVLHADLSRHPEVRERFLREGYAANRVEHPGVVKVLDDDVIAAGPDSGIAYLVMELLEGESLQERLERSPAMGEREFLTIAESVLDVLAAAHARGVVHRDLKPENLFLLRDAKPGPGAAAAVKVLDFGLARLLQGQAITSYGLALGTPSFMSPEQAAGRTDEIDGRTDLFALAATGFRLRTGRRIHEGANAVELVTKMASVPAPRIRVFAPDASEPFARVVDRALEFRKEDRYGSAAAMRDDVRRAIAQIDAGILATQMAVPVSPVTAPAAEPTIEASERDLLRSESVRIPRRRSFLPWLVLLVALGGIGAILWLGARKAPTAEIGVATSSATPEASMPVRGSAQADEQPLDAGADTPAEMPREMAVASSSAVRSPPPPAVVSGVRRAAPPSVGVGNVHKLPATRPARSKGAKSLQHQ